jgi:hypothetical protein
MPSTLSRREQLIIEVTDRLHRVCAHWPPDEFADLVLRVVDTTMKYEGRVTPPAEDRARIRRPRWGADVQ